MAKINLSDYNQLGKNHKPLKDATDEAGNQIFQITKGNERIWYIEEDGKREIIEVFNKKNHQTTDQSRKSKL